MMYFRARQLQGSIADCLSLSSGNPVHHGVESHQFPSFRLLFKALDSVERYAIR
jgi:hypothetical protein